MLIKDLKNCPEFISGDGCILRELLHGPNEKLEFRYSLAYAIVKPGQKSFRHSLKTSEIYYILQGEGLIHIDDDAQPVRPDQAVVIPIHGVQYIENTGTNDLVFLCMVDPGWRMEDEVVL